MDALDQEHVHKREFFGALKPWIDGGATAAHAKVAVALKMSETALLVVFVWGCRPPQVSSPQPLPAGHVEIHVAFKGIPTEAYNKLSGFLMNLAEEHSALRQGSESLRDVGDRHSYGGMMNDAFAVQQYNPNHPVHSPEVEQTMKERLKTFLVENDIDPDDAQLKLRYGK